MKSIARIASLFLLSLFMFCDSSFGQNLDSGLVAYFPFNGDVKDNSTLAIHGTPYDLTGAKNRNGGADSAYNFNGKSSYANCGISNRSITSTVTFSAWVLTDSADDNYIVWKYDSDIDRGYIFSLYQQGLIVAGRNGAGKFIVSGPSSTKIDDNKWHHVAASIDGNSWKVYVDCVLEASVTSTSANPNLANSKLLTIGRHNNATSNEYKWFKGSIDELRMYNRLLSKDELDILCGNKPNSIGMHEFTPEMEIYPNPTHGLLNITALPAEAKSVSIYSTNGQLLLVQMNELSNLDVSGLAKGVYLLQVHGQKGELLKTHKFVKS